MRVITGSAKGRSLETPSGEGTRPTAERVKEGLFSAIQFELEGRRVLDLFAGSGQLGIEALSRGAQSAVFCDMSKEAAEIVKKNLERTGFSDRAFVHCGDSLAYLRTCRLGFDIIFLDPPYASGLLLFALDAAASRTSPGGVVVCEVPFGTDLPEGVGCLTAYKTYKYGKTAVVIYRRTTEEAT